MERACKFLFLSGIMLLLAWGRNPVQAQQRYQFSQYMFNGLVLNPAYAGCDEALSLTFYNRNQWNNVEGAPTTQTLSAHTLFRRQHIGSGLTIVNDEIGAHQNLYLSAAISYHLNVSTTSVLSFGLQGGLSHRESDYQSLGGNPQNDPKIASNTIAHNLIDFGAGVYFRSRLLHAGISVPEITPGKLNVNDTVSLSFNRRQGMFFGKVKCRISGGVQMEPGFLLKYFPGTPYSYDVNANFIFQNVLIAGVSYRKEESIDFLLRAQITPQLQVGYGYDYVIGDLATLSQSSHELMVNYQFKFTRNNFASPR